MCACTCTASKRATDDPYSYTHICTFLDCRRPQPLDLRCIAFLWIFGSALLGASAFADSAAAVPAQPLGSHLRYRQLTANPNLWGTFDLWGHTCAIDS